MQDWLRPKHGAKYADVGERTYRMWFKRGLRSVRVKGVILTKVEWIDAWLQEHEINQDNEIDTIHAENRGPRQNLAGDFIFR